MKSDRYNYEQHSPSTPHQEFLKKRHGRFVDRWIHPNWRASSTSSSCIKTIFYNSPNSSNVFDCTKEILSESRAVQHIRLIPTRLNQVSDNQI